MGLPTLGLLVLRRHPGGEGGFLSCFLLPFNKATEQCSNSDHLTVIIAPLQKVVLELLLMCTPKVMHMFHHHKDTPLALSSSYGPGTAVLCSKVPSLGGSPNLVTF